MQPALPVSERQREKRMAEKYREVERLLRDVLKVTTEPLVDTYIRRALYWLEQCR